MNKYQECPYFKWCPHKTALCKVVLPDEDCPLYKYLKKIIEETKKENE